MKVVVTGANGQLGADVVSYFRAQGCEVFPFTHADLDITDTDAVTKTIAAIKPDVVINTAAYHHVEHCENNPDIATTVNTTAVGHLAQLGAKENFRLIHISTDYVFDGEKRAPYIETDAVNPLNVYGQTKAEGEKLVLNASPNHAVVRISAIYGTEPCRAKGGMNFIKLMLKLAKEKDQLQVVNNEFVSPTNTLAIAAQLYKIATTPNATGILHATSEGQCSWYEFAIEIFKLTHTKIDVVSVEAANFSKIKRPGYSVLENQRLKQLGINQMPHWKESLQQYLQTITAS
ncbi:MAG: dTDP-4-dehydrorhamnose reductase [Bacteroidia bacterium]|nr:dTDP-4-dehydrorhamnose reductase [Bacteroidia bacterium]